MLKVLRLVIVISIALPVQAQNNFFTEAFEMFSRTNFYEFEKINVNWNMQGKLQADLNEGLNSLLEENPGGAELNFSAVLSKDSTLWQAYYFRAAAYKQMNKLSLAERDLKHVLKLNSTSYEAHIELAKIYHLRFQLQDSERILKKAVQLNRVKPMAYYLMGDINLAQNQIRIATNNFRDCLEADSMFHDARIKLSLLDYIEKKDVIRALGHLDRVLRYDSLQKSALMFRSIFTLESNKGQSIQDLSRLILVSPRNRMALYLRGRLNTELEYFEEAYADFQKLIKSIAANDNNFVGKQSWIDKQIDIRNIGSYFDSRVYGLSEADKVKMKRALCYVITGTSLEKSLSTINQITNPGKEPLAPYLIAVIFEHQGDHNKAIRYYKMALDLDNDIVDAHKKMGIYRQELKQWESSVAEFTKVLELTPDAYVIYSMRGVSYFYMNKFSEAIQDYNEYLKFDSTNVDVISYRGMAFLRDNQRLLGYLDLVRSNHLEKLNFGDIQHLVDSILIKGDTTIAVDVLTRITKKAPYFTEGFVQKFAIHLARNEWQAIENDILRALQNSRMDASKSDHSFLLTLQAITFARNKHTSDALKAFNEALTFDKQNSFCYLERGKLYMATGNKTKAESDFKRASLLGNRNARQLLTQD